MTMLLNHHLDNLLKTNGDRHTIFLRMGSLGAAMGITWTLILAALTGRLLWLTAVLDGIAIATFLGLAMLVKIVTGQERLTNYHHQIVIFTIATLFLWWQRQPILVYLDGLCLGVAIVFAVGRIGCFRAGCCHGRLHPWGVCYDRSHNLPRHLTHRRLFPVQLAQAAWLWLLILTGTFFILTDQLPGTTLAVYLIGYSIGRFGLEFWRGDVARPYWGPLSEAQWTAVLFVLVVTAAQVSELLPLSGWSLVAAAAFLLWVLVLLLYKPWQQRRALWQPQHIQEIAQVLERLSPTSPGDEIQVITTRLGLQLSRGEVVSPDGRLDSYTLSHATQPLTEKAARRLAHFIHLLQFPDQAYSLQPGREALFHLLVYQEAKQEKGILK